MNQHFGGVGYGGRNFAGANFNRNFGFNGYGGGGWNHLGNRSYFFGNNSPFRGYYGYGRGLGYGGYGYGRGWGYGGYGYGRGWGYGGYGGYGGWGYPGYGYGWGGWGYPGFGYGLAWGLGYGLGLGLGGYGYGYPYYGYGYAWNPYGYGYGYPYYSSYGYGNYGYGYPYSGYGYGNYGYGSPYSGYGYSGYGYGNYGYGYPSSYASLNSYYGNGYGYGYPSTGYSTYAVGMPTTANYGSSYGTLVTLNAAAPAPGPAYAGDSQVISSLAQVPPGQPEAGNGAAPNVDQLTAADFAAQAEVNFKAGRYDAAARDYRHALVDDPQNPGVLMLLGQTAFAVGQYNEAAGATEMGMKSLPPDKWGSVLTNYQQLYPDQNKFTEQLRALEKARNEKPSDPALRFVLGYEYYYLGFTKEAFRELDKAIQLQPKDPFARQLRNMAATKLGEPVAEAPPGTEPLGPPQGAAPPPPGQQAPITPGR